MNKRNRTLMLKYSNNDIGKIQNTVGRLDNTDATNPIGWLLTCDWNLSPSRAKKTGFNDFHEREYDYDALEAVLLARSRL